MHWLNRLPVWAWLLALLAVVWLLNLYGRANYVAGFRDGLQNMDSVEDDAEWRDARMKLERNR